MVDKLNKGQSWGGGAGGNKIRGSDRGEGQCERGPCKRVKRQRDWMGQSNRFGQREGDKVKGGERERSEGGPDLKEGGGDKVKGGESERSEGGPD